MPTVMAIAAHPDDIEFLMSGTLLLLMRAGYRIHYMNCANGSCGTDKLEKAEIVRIRRAEAIAAATYLGATFHESICDDLAIFYDRPTLAKLASSIRDAAPDILLTHSPDDYMEDHMNVCRLAVTAAFARDAEFPCRATASGCRGHGRRLPRTALLPPRHAATSN